MSPGSRPKTLTDRQAKNPPVGSGAAWFVPFADRLAGPWSVLAMSDGVWKYVGWDRIIAGIASHRGQPLIESLQAAARLRSGRFPTISRSWSSRALPDHAQCGPAPVIYPRG